MSPPLHIDEQTNRIALNKQADEIELLVLKCSKNKAMYYTLLGALLPKRLSAGEILLNRTSGEEEPRAEQKRGR